MPRLKPIVSALFLAALPSLALGAGKYSWFSDGATDPNALQFRPSSFGTEIYRSLRPSDDAVPVTESTVSLYGDYSSRQSALADSRESARPFANFGVRWQHRVSSQDRLSVSAEQGESTLPRSTTANTDMLNTRATISWTRDLAWSWRPSITGGFFLGDESGREDISRSAGRRYYGFSVGGELRLLQAHTPYVSFRMERSLYDVSDAGAVTGGPAVTSSAVSGLRGIDDSSRLAAGWRWRAAPGLSFQAEASYGFNFDTNSDVLWRDRERSRVFFGTRFDFK
jgi:hypothetical protein